MATALALTGQLDPRSAWQANDCSIAPALDGVSTRSGFLLLREASYGTTRFEEFADRAGSVSRWPPPGCGARVQAELPCSEGHPTALGELEAAVGPRKRRQPAARSRRNPS